MGPSRGFAYYMYTTISVISERNLRGDRELAITFLFCGFAGAGQQWAVRREGRDHRGALGRFVRLPEKWGQGRRRSLSR